MSMVSPAPPALPPAVEDALPLKLRLADDGSCAACSDTCFGSDRDHHSDTDEDLASELWPVGPIGPPPGLELEAGAAVPAGRTPLRSHAAAYSPLRSQTAAFVPRSLALAGGQRPRLGGAGSKAPQWTTVMMRNVPCSYTCDSLIDLLEAKGFSKWFDFVYVPVKRTEVLGVGYAFVNIVNHELAEKFALAFEGFDGWAPPSSKTPCSVHWSVCQGLQENIRRYRNSPLMSDDVPALYKPVLLRDGVRVPFPRPTKKLAARRHKAKDDD